MDSEEQGTSVQPTGGKARRVKRASATGSSASAIARVKTRSSIRLPYPPAAKSERPRSPEQRDNIATDKRTRLFEEPHGIRVELLGATTLVMLIAWSEVQWIER